MLSVHVQVGIVTFGVLIVMMGACAHVSVRLLVLAVDKNNLQARTLAGHNYLKGNEYLRAITTLRP